MGQLMRSGKKSVDTETVFGAIPHGIFGILQRALQTDDLWNRLTLLHQTFEAALKHVTLVLIAQYRMDGIPNEAVEKSLAKLTHPSLGMFSGLLREIIKHYSADRIKIHPLANPEIVRWYDACYHEENTLDDDTFKALLSLSEIADYTTPKSKRARTCKQLVDVLVTYRNKVIGHGTPPLSSELKARHLPALETCVCSFLMIFLPVLSFPLIEVLEEDSHSQNRYRLKTWSGYGLAAPEWRETPSSLVPGRTCVEVRNETLNGETGPDLRPEPYFLEIYPFCLVHYADHKADLFFLNDAKKAKIELLSYTQGEKRFIGKTDALFSDIQEALNRFGEVPRGGDGLEAYQFDLLEVSEDAIDAFNKAEAVVKDDQETAVVLLEHAVAMSPAFRDAVNLLAELKTTLGRFEEAQRTYRDYLRLVPDDVPFLISEAKLLLEMHRPDDARNSIREALSFDITNTEAQALQDQIMDILHQPYADGQSAAQDSFRLILPYEYVLEGATGYLPEKQKGITFLVIALFIAALTGGCAAAFYLNADLIMSLTALSMGIVWAVTIWSSFRMRNIIMESRANFAAFLRSRKGQGKSANRIEKLIRPIFGIFPDRAHVTRAAYVRRVFKRNWKRICFEMVAGLLLAFWIFSITVSLTHAALAAALYAVFLFFVSWSIAYYFVSMFFFQRMIRDMRNQEIHFSLVQHPKLSIRYLSGLSRRLSYQLLAIYVLSAFTLYLGPFKANLAFIIAITLLIFVTLYLYYNTIFLVRRVIIQNKWRLISKFSIHFDEPFDNLIRFAKKNNMQRIRELIDIRDFLDAMDIWAEKKRVLLLVSFLYLVVIFGSTIWLSNVMTRTVVPKLSHWAQQKLSNTDSRFKLPYEDVNAPVTSLDVSVSGVDDTYIVMWADDPAYIRDTGNWRIGDKFEQMPPPPIDKNGFRRCDWHSGVHGVLNFALPFDGEEKYILLAAYNKVYRGFLFMGGGKLSYECEIAYGNQTLFQERSFIRTNDRRIYHLALMHLKKAGDGLHVRLLDGRGIISRMDKAFPAVFDRIEAELGQEPNAFTFMPFSEEDGQ